MELGRDRIILKYDTEGPIDLEKLVGSFTGLANQYRRVLQLRGLKPGETDARLFITRIQNGCVEAEIATAAVAFASAFQFMDYSLILVDFTIRTKAVLDYFTGKSSEKPALTKQDCTDFRDFLGAVSHHADGAISYKHARFHKTSIEGDKKEEVIAEFSLDKPQIDKAERNIGSEISNLTALEAPRFRVYDDMLLYWYQTNVEKGRIEGRTADKAIIADISPKPLKVYFPRGAETLKHKMTNLQENPFRKGFVVQVHVQYVGDEPMLYTILDVREVIDFEEGENDYAQGSLK